MNLKNKILDTRVNEVGKQSNIRLLKRFLQARLKGFLGIRERVSYERALIKVEVRVLLEHQMFSMCNIQADQEEQLGEHSLEEQITHLTKLLEDLNITLVAHSQITLKPSLVEMQDMPLDQVTKCMELQE